MDKYIIYDKEMKRISKPYTIGDYAIEWQDDVDIPMPIQFGIAKDRLVFHRLITTINGQDIYEGFTVFSFTDKGDYIYILKYDDKKMKYLFSCICHTEHKLDDLWDNRHDINYLKVIGNIYKFGIKL